MIFVTVGTQLSFDRMIRTIDAWAGNHARGDVFAQVGPSTYRPQHIAYSKFVDADEFRNRVQQAQVVIAHAGMGSIITALEMGKPIVVMPRRAELGEHRNDHQVATARRFLAQGRVTVAFDEEHLVEKLSTMSRMNASQPIAKEASPLLLDALRRFIKGGKLGMSEVFPDSQAPMLHPASRGAAYETSAVL